MPFVSGFGLAKIIEKEGNLTLTEAVLGTASYMAPEQAAGQSKTSHDLRRHLQPGCGPLRIAHRPGAVSRAHSHGNDAPGGRAWLCHQDEATIQSHLEYTCKVAFSPDGTRVAAAGDRDGVIRVWDVGALEPVATWGGQNSWFGSQFFLEDNQTLAFDRNDGRLMLWDRRPP